MGAKTAIEWTDKTFNPWWGCTKVSAGCTNCYAEVLDRRLGDGHWGPGRARRVMSDKHWAEPLKWNKAAEKARRRTRVFCASMADVFDEEVRQEWRDRLWALIDRTGWLDWQLLTKRPGNISAMLPPGWVGHGWPNVWLGVSVENQEMADKRIPLLLQVPAKVLFLSCEPLIGPVDLSRWLPWRIQTNGWNGPEHFHQLPAEGGSRGPDWVIVGGESGPGARPFDLAWARSLVQQCKTAGVWCFVKQLGTAPTSIADRISHRGDKSERPNGFYRHLNDRKGGDWSEWPEDLRVREFPEVAP